MLRIRTALVRTPDWGFCKK